MPNDPFAVLGLTSAASEDEIKSAYRKLAKKYHPDLNPGNQAAEEKMREINDAYTRALQIKKTGRDPSANPYGSGGNSYGYSGFSNQQHRNQAYQRESPYQSQEENPFGDFGFGFDPFSAFFGNGYQQQTRTRTRQYANPELKTAESHVLSNRFHDAVSLLNRIPDHDADWHAIYARAEHGLGNRISALDHARSAVRLAPQDSDYQQLLQTIERGRETYHRTRSSGYDFRSAICSNPCLTCCAANMLLNCCLGGRGFGFWC